MKAQELHSKTHEDLVRILRDTEKELHEKKMAHATGQLKQHTELARLKKSIARIRTILHTQNA